MPSPLPFRPKRGRPPTIKPKQDHGTKELKAKRRAKATLEAIDLCYCRGLITEEMLRAGLHYRWLYSVRNGSPFISAYVPDYMKYSGSSERGENHQSYLEQQFLHATMQLKIIRAERIVMNLCIYNHMPKQPLPLLQEGLTLLSKTFFH